MPNQDPRFFFASHDEIRSGAVTDIYFLRTKQVLEARGLDKRVRVEVGAKGLPEGYEWAVLAGLEDVLRLLEGRPVTVEGLPEGSLFKAYQPVLSIEGRYLDFGLYETALLGFLCQASGVATKAARCRRLIGAKPLIHFGTRRMHPAIAPMLDRSAYIGSCDGVSVVLSAEKLGIPPSGTIPHALVLLVGDTLETARAFHEVIDPAVRRVALIDTFQDEKFEALRLAAGLGMPSGRCVSTRRVRGEGTSPVSSKRCAGNSIYVDLRTSSCWSRAGSTRPIFRRSYPGPTPLVLAPPSAARRPST